MLLLRCSTEVENRYTLGGGGWAWAGWFLICDPLGSMGACTSMGVVCCGSVVVAAVQVMVQVFLGWAMACIWAGEVFFCYGMKPSDGYLQVGSLWAVLQQSYLLGGAIGKLPVLLKKRSLHERGSDAR